MARYEGLLCETMRRRVWARRTHTAQIGAQNDRAFQCLLFR
jgi:hypothetical protein